MSYRKSEGNAVFLIDKIPNTTIDAPVVAVGKVVPTSTGDREATQNPMTGFLCDGTPLGKGHIIALFLGGPDIPENYAPQYEQWQQGGAWKTMENDIKKAAPASGNSVDLYMVVRLTYGNTGNTYSAQKARFAKNEIFAWTERCIPTRFEVKTFKSSDNGAAAKITAMFGQDATGALTALTNIATDQSFAPNWDFKVTGMPDEDYKFWLKNLVRGNGGKEAAKAKDDYDKYMEANTTKVVVAAVTAPVSKQVASKSAASGKRGYHKATSTAVVPRRSLRVDPAYKQLQEDAQARFGFKDNPNFASATWQTQNVKDLPAAVKTVLAGDQDHFGVKIADYNKLTANDVAAANMISGMIG